MTAATVGASSGLPLTLLDLTEPMIVLAGRLLPEDAGLGDGTHLLVAPTTIAHYPAVARRVLAYFVHPRLLREAERDLPGLGVPTAEVLEVIDAAPVFVCRPGTPSQLATQLARVHPRATVTPRPGPPTRPGVFLPVDARRGVFLSAALSDAVFADAPLGVALPCAAASVGVAVEQLWAEVFAAIMSVLQTGTAFLAVTAGGPAEAPSDHPTLAKYPGHPTVLYRGEDGILWRIPLGRDRDEAVAVPVEDLVQSRGAVHQLKLMIEGGAGGDVDLQMVGHVIAGISAVPPPQTRGEVIRSLDGLRDRLTGSLPGW